uniref:C2 NT-type domain-containing protein n=1 Tax=Erythrolobus madagascarensis TaxID=708628 RepID=A0A7S0XID2_9RHOD
MKRESSLRNLLTPRGRKQQNGGALNDDDDDEPKSMGKMMRASSRRLGAVGGASAGLLKNALKNSTRVGQLPFQFRFEIHIESLEKLDAATIKAGTASKLVVSVIRNDKSYHTQPFSVNAAAKNASVDDTISFDLTLFKTKEEDTTFCEKLYKIAVRDAKDASKGAAGGGKAQSLAKIMLDLSEYAAAPSGSRRVAAALNTGAQIVARIDSTFVSAGRSTKSVAGGDSNSRGAPSEWGDDSVCGDDEIFDDLDEFDDDNQPKSGLFGRGLSFRNMSFRKNNKQSKKEPAMPVDDDPETAEMRKRLERLENENQRLEKQNDNLLSKIAAGYSSQTNAGGGGLFGKKNKKKEEAELKQLIRDNQALKVEIKQLSTVLEAEKEVDEVVEELKEAKLELAVAYLEKEQVHLNLMTIQRSKR